MASMKIIFQLVVFLSLFTNSSFSQEINLKNNDSVVFIGDELTQQTLYTQYLENFFITQNPDIRLKFHNAGINYSTSQDVIDRFAEDVASYKPKYAFILLGRHDAAFRKFNYKDLNGFTSRLSLLIESLKDIGAKAILISPTPFEAHKLKNKTISSDYNETLAYYSAAVRKLALEYDCPFIDLYSELNAESYQKRQQNPDESITHDGLNLKESYHALVASRIIKALGFKSLKTKIAIHFKNKMITEVKHSSGSVIKTGKHYFSVQPRYLPWYGVHDFVASRESEKLSVTGLDEGLYLVKINQKHIAYWTAAELREGVDLSRAKHSPQSRHAQNIKDLNAIRNSHLIALRKMWNARIKYEKLSQLNQSTEGERAKLVRLKARLSGFEYRQDKILAQADKLLNQIYKIAKPSKLVFEFLPATSLAPINYSKTELKPGLNYKSYISPKDTFWDRLPDFDLLTVHDSGKVKKPSLSVKPQADNFAIVFKGFIKIPKDGLYTFTLNSDDGAKLYLNKKVIVDHDGLHSRTEKFNRIPLTKGVYPFKLEFFESVGYEGVFLYWSSTDLKREEVPESAYFSE